MKPVQISIPPNPGQQLLYVCLNDLHHTSLLGCLEILHNLGYENPQLAYSQNRETFEVYLCLLLAVKEVELESEIPPLLDEWTRVGLAFGEDCNAVHAPMRQAATVAIAA